MRYGFIIPGGDLETIVSLAREAEAAGWDGVFYWDGIYIAEAGPMFDPWVTLAAIATVTSRVRIGAIISPLSRRRPWKVARETMTLDHLSHGRLVVPVGLGALDDGGFGKVGEPTDRRTRAELLDESLEILTGLWTGQPFTYSGKHYHLDEMTFLPPPLQQPRIPVWVVGAWPRERSLRRALRYDGILPDKLDPDGTRSELAPDDVRAIRAYAAERRPDGASGFDIVVEGQTPGDDPARASAIVREWADAGATWWNEAMWDAMHAPERVRTRILQGPPRGGE
ncbi:MAG TPA: LLM class flavin-dependent oxidoreductase [Ktedonobacterales bacterium]|nr:LLM class flavin-dependent oxidoreductase [Ktedonobacterales bacterium]